MNYQAALDNLTDDLVELLAAEPIPADEAVPARLAQQEVITSLSVVYADLVQTRVQSRHPDPARIAEHPVAALRELIDRPDPTFPDERPPPPVSTAGRAWSRARGNAALAMHAWSSSTTDSRPIGEKRWTAIADLAAIFEAVSMTGPSPMSALGLAAREVRRIATLGPLPIPDQVVPQPSKPIRVRSQRDLAPALFRLSQLIDQAARLDPASLGRISQHLAAVCVALLQDRKLAGSPVVSSGLATELERVERVIRPPVTFTRGVAASDPRTDRRPEAQAFEVVHALQRGPVGTGGRVDRLEPEVVAAICGALPVVLRTLERAASRQVQTGQWLVPSPGLELRWVTAAAADDTPHALRHLRDGAAASARLRTWSWRQPPTDHAELSLAGRLAPAVRSHGQRPPDPGQIPAVAR
jgi:hypothetical protein